jgi:hypothetical protein
VLVCGHAFAGDPGAGLAAIDRALRLPGTRLWESEYRRLRAELGAALGHPRHEVEADLTTAAQVADARGQRGPAQRTAETRSRLLTRG